MISQASRTPGEQPAMKATGGRNPSQKSHYITIQMSLHGQSRNPPCVYVCMCGAGGAELRNRAGVFRWGGNYSKVYHSII